MSNRKNKDFIKLHFIVLIWGFTAILGSLITIPSVEIVFYRTLLSAIGLGIVLFWRKIPFSVPKKALPIILFTGVMIGFHWIFFFAAARVSTVSVCLVGMATTSLWTSLIEPLFNKKKISIYEVSLGLLVIAGLYIIFKFEFEHGLGLTLAILSALIAAFFSVSNSFLTKKYNHYVLNFYEMIGACIVTVLFFPIYTHYFTEGVGLQLKMTNTDIIYMTILALVCTVYAYSASIELMKRISAFALNLVVNLEPVYGIILALIIFGDKEKMAPEFYFGTFIILLSVLSYPVLNKWLLAKSGSLPKTGR